MWDQIDKYIIQTNQPSIVTVDNAQKISRYSNTKQEDREIPGI